MEATSAQSTSSAKSADDCERWLRRVHEVQSSRMTAEQRTELIAKVERARMAEVSRRKVKAVKSHAVRSKALVSEGLRQMSCAAAPQEFQMVQDRWAMAQEASSKRAKESVSKMVALQERRADAEEAAMVVAQAEEDEEDEGMAEVAALVGAAEPSALVRAADVSDDAADREFEELLKQLRKEPTADEELAAKFGLYETYSEEVVKMRTTIFGLYEENKPTLPDAVKNDMEKQLKRIDRDEAMGIQDDAREWFVYNMLKVAGRNNTHMSGIMENFEKRLEFLASNDQDECPICLEKFSADSPAETLGCCHKVCRECWANWVAVMHGHPFCPLCKNEEFVETIHRRASV